MSETRTQLTDFHLFNELPAELKKLIGETLTDIRELSRLARTDWEMSQLLKMEIKNRFLIANKPIKLVGLGSNSMVLTQEGALYATGRNRDGELGNGTRRLNKFFQRTVKGIKVADIIVREGRTFILGVNKRVYAIGNNFACELFTGTGRRYASPKRLENLPPIIKIKMRYGSLRMLSKDGHVYVGGDNAHGQLGIGDAQSIFIPRMMPGLENIVDFVETSEGCLFLRNDGLVLACGDNSHLELGLPETRIYFEPTIVPNITNVDKIFTIVSGVFFRVKLENLTKLYAMGHNTHGRLGVGKNDLLITQPTLVDLNVEIEDVYSAADSTFYTDKLGKVHSVGDNSKGNLGLGHRFNCLSPKLISTLVNVVVTRVESSDGLICFNVKNGPMYVCGTREAAARVLPNLDVTMPILQPMPLPWAIDIKKNVHGGGVYSFYANNGAMLGWGNNADYALGLPDPLYVKPTKMFLPHVRGFLSLCSVPELFQLAAMGADDYHHECFRMAFDRISYARHGWQIAEVLPYLRSPRFNEHHDMLQEKFPGYRDLLESVRDRPIESTEIYRAYGKLLMYMRELQNDRYEYKRFTQFLQELSKLEEEKEQDSDDARRHCEKDSRDGGSLRFFCPAPLAKYKDFLEKLQTIPKQYLQFAAQILATYFKPPNGSEHKHKAEGQPENQQDTKKLKSSHI